MIKLVGYLTVLATLLPLPSLPQGWAQVTSTLRRGADSSGGGDVVVFDDRVVLADAYGHTNGIEIKEFPPLVISELKRIGWILVGYGAAGSYDEPRFLKDYVFSSLIEYLFVDRIPERASCANRIPLEGVPQEAKVEQVACTDGFFTYIRKDLFQQMSVRDQARLIFHERLRALPGAANEMIADMSNDVNTALELYNEQILGGKPVLTEEQEVAIRRLRRRVFQAGMTPSVIRELGLSEATLSDWNVTRNGGGLIQKNAVVDPTAYVGIGVAVAEDNFLLKNSVVVATSTCAHPPGSYSGDGSTGCVLNEGAVARNVKTASLTLHAFAEATDVDAWWSVWLGAHAKAERLSGVLNVTAGARASIEDLKANGTKFHRIQLADDARISSVTLNSPTESADRTFDYYQAFVLEPNSSLSNLVLDYQVRQIPTALRVLRGITDVPTMGLANEFRQQHTAFRLPPGAQVDFSDRRPCPAGKRVTIRRRSSLDLSRDLGRSCR